MLVSTSITEIPLNVNSYSLYNILSVVLYGCETVSHIKGKTQIKGI